MTDVWPTLYIPHGGGPCFFMEPPVGLPRDVWDGMAAFLRGIDGMLGRRPSAVLVISSHWEAKRPTVNVAERPALLFDYYGFPPHTYQLTYPVDGVPALAGRVRALFHAAGIATDEEEHRGIDHGVFVPFKLIYPDADVPLVELSLEHGLDAARHMAIGRALAPLRSEGVLIVGSGMSYHNIGGLMSGRGNDAAQEFDRWLVDAVADPSRRDEALASWQSAPGAAESHPEAEHLLPLMVAAGAAAGEPAHQIFGERVFGKAVSGFRFGERLTSVQTDLAGDRYEVAPRPV